MTLGKNVLRRIISIMLMIVVLIGTIARVSSSSFKRHAEIIWILRKTADAVWLFALAAWHKAVSFSPQLPIVFPCVFFHKRKKFATQKNIIFEISLYEIMSSFNLPGNPDLRIISQHRRD